MFNFAELKKFFLFNLIGSLIISALVAVITVLIGDFNEITIRVLLTLLMVIIHSVISLCFIWDDKRQDTFDRLALFANSLFIIIVLSFLVSIFGIWEIIKDSLVLDLYQTFFVLGFAALHANILAKALNKENYIDLVVYLNYVFMAGVVLMLMPIIYVENAFRILGELYFRVLAAIGIIDGTLSILTIIFYKLYLHKHPQAENTLGALSPEGSKPKKKGLSIWVWILIIYLILQIFAPFIFYRLF